MHYVMDHIHKGTLAASLAVLIFFNLGAVVPAHAATIVSSPAQISVASGDTFSVRYSINPQGEKNYTAKLVLGFPANTLKVTSFQFGSGWTPLLQPGYDLVDNTQGTLIKTAGYPKGISATTVFGTVQFQVIGTASGTISVQNGTLVLNAKNKNVLVPSPAVATVIVTTPAAAATPTGVPAQQPPQQNLFDVNLQTVSNQVSSQSLPAFIIAAMLVGIVLVGLIAFGVWRWYKKRVQQQQPPPPAPPTV